MAFWSCIKKPGLIRKVRLISKFLTSEPEEQYIAIHILSNTPRGKGNHTTKFGQLIKYNSRNIFLEVWWKNYPEPFSEKSKSSIALDKKSKLLQFVVIVSQVEGYPHILKQICGRLTFTTYEAFLRNKKVWD